MRRDECDKLCEEIRQLRQSNKDIQSKIRAFNTRNSTSSSGVVVDSSHNIDVTTQEADPLQSMKYKCAELTDQVYITNCLLILTVVTYYIN